MTVTSQMDSNREASESMTMDTNQQQRRPSWKNWIGKAMVVMDSTFLLIVFIAQAAVLDYFMIANNDGESQWYFWLFGDFVLFAFLIVGIVSAYRHHSHRCTHKVDAARRASLESQTSVDGVMDEIDFPQARPTSPMNSRFHGGIFALNFPKCMGVLPLIYMIWFAYSVLLITKIIILFKLQIAQKFSEEKMMGVPLFKISIAASAVIFLLWVEANRDKCDTNQELKTSVGGSVASELQSHTVFELFDSIEFLHLVLPQESHLMVPFWMENLVLGLASVNFIIPTISLLRLSLAHMGKYRGTSFAVLLTLIISVLRFMLVNLPYFWLRVHFWSTLEHDVSIFILKNFLGIISTMRHIIPEVRVYLKLRRKEKRRRTSKINPENGDDSGSKPKKRVTISSIPFSVMFNPDEKNSSLDNPLESPHDQVALRRTSSSSESAASPQRGDVDMKVQPSSPSTTTTSNSEENEMTKI